MERTFEHARAFYRVNAAAGDELISFGESRPDAALDSVELAALTVVANQILNLDEFITRD